MAGWTSWIVAALLLAAVLAVRHLFRSIGPSKNSEPGHCLVFLLSQFEMPTESALRRLIGQALGLDLETGDPQAQWFVLQTPQDPALEEEEEDSALTTFLVKVPQGMYILGYSTAPYWPHPKQSAQDIEDRHLQKAVAAHQAFVSCQPVKPAENQAQAKESFQAAALILTAVAGPLTLAVYDTLEGRCTVFTTEVSDALKGEDPFSVFGEPALVPVVSVDETDPRMQAAVEQAKKRWPEFVDAFTRNTDTQARFFVKAPFSDPSNTEFMWVWVTDIREGRIRGVLANSPADVEGLKENDPVAVDVSQVSDWIFTTGENTFGGFTVDVIEELVKEKKQTLH